MRLDTGVREDAKRRLLSVKGHVEGILRMLEDEQVYCVDVLKQLKAVNGALDKVGAMVLHSHLKRHVVTAHDGHLRHGGRDQRHSRREGARDGRRRHGHERDDHAAIGGRRRRRCSPQRRPSLRRRHVPGDALRDVPRPPTAPRRTDLAD